MALNNPIAHSILGMRLDYLDWQDGVGKILDFAKSGVSSYCCIPDVNECVLCHDDAAHRDIVNGSDLVMSDSMILQQVRALVHRVPRSATIKGADIMAELCKGAAAQGIAIALIGGRDNETLEKLKQKLIERFPELKIVYAFSPPFRAMADKEDERLVAELVESRAQLIFVGLGCPKQERWMAAHKGRIQATMVGIGAAFDFISGAVRPSPPWVHKAGVEWLYRLLSEPRRLWRRYLVVAPRFLWLVATSKILTYHNSFKC